MTLLPRVRPAASWWQRCWPAFLPCWLAAQAGADTGIRFNRDVRPILSDQCFSCHGFDAKTRKAGLRLDVPDGLSEPGPDGKVILNPGNPEASELWLRVTSEDADEVMPPPESHKSLTAEQRETLRRWIAQGAPYEGHWAFVAPELPTVPAGEGTGAIDAFVRDRLAREGLAPAPEADRETLLRRVTFDLTGLPPSLEEIEAFLGDATPGAYERVVDRLLASPHHGEHQARYWLDLARYADTHGLHLDNERSMWPYRDWVVQAFHRNLPFDQFTRWQLGGDLLPEPNRDQRVASGFNRCNVTTSEGGSIGEEFVYRYAVDRTSTAVEVWMALTAGCAVCHDHKFDPLSTKEFYSLYAFFHSAADPAMDGNRIDTPPVLKLATPEQEARLAEVEARIGDVNRRVREAVAALAYVDPAEQDPAPGPRVVETAWFEDGFPPGTKPQSSGSPSRIVGRGEGEVFRGEKALRREARGVEQDHFAGGVEFVVPAGGKVFVHCFLDAAKPPEAVMVQFHVGGWSNRVVWGDAEKIPFGKAGTPEKVALGPLPEAGKWARLEFDASEAGLKPGSKVTGYAFTQAGGIVTWDRLGVAATVDPVQDPAWSFRAWVTRNQGKRVEGLPGDLQNLVRSKKPEEWSEAERTRVREHWLEHLHAGADEVLGPLKAERVPWEEARRKLDAEIPLTFVMQDLPTPRESFVMLRGAYDKPGEPVRRDTPAFLPPLGAPEGKVPDRLDLADWLLRPDHPLTARVAVNRFWQQFFGTGLVKTSSDFGSQGEPPSHPELLDWLAVTFVESGWDTRALLKRIVLSATYRQDSRVTPELLARDPENRLLARGPRFRLDAEMLRDNVLFVSGLLDPTLGGKGVRPYQPPNIWEPVGFGGSNTREYKQDTGNALYRRSLYTFLKRTAPPPFLATFDAPNREQSCSRRERSNTPLQALQLLNDVQHFEAARELAARMLRHGGSTPEERIAWGWRAVTARRPGAEEVAIVRETLAEHQARYAADPEAARAAVSYGERPPDASLPPEELAAYTLVANLLFNLDETVTKN